MIAGLAIRDTKGIYTLSYRIAGFEFLQAPQTGASDAYPGPPSGNGDLLIAVFLSPTRTRHAPETVSLSSAISMGTPGRLFDERMASSDFTTLTLGAGVSRVVRKR